MTNIVVWKATTPFSVTEEQQQRMVERIYQRAISLSDEQRSRIVHVDHADPAAVVYVGRWNNHPWHTIGWGNPVRLRRDPKTGRVIDTPEERERVLRLYIAWLIRQPRLMALLSELAHKTLACHCSPKLCHGLVLLALAETIE